MIYFVNNSEHQNQFSDSHNDHKIYWLYGWIVQGISIDSGAENWRKTNQSITKSPETKEIILFWLCNTSLELRSTAKSAIEVIGDISESNRPVMTLAIWT